MDISVTFDFYRAAPHGFNLAFESDVNQNMKWMSCVYAHMDWGFSTLSKYLIGFGILLPADFL